jgi:UDP-glucose 4-epimerase
MNILVTGGAGYIGSHICLELLQNNHDVVVLDNYANSSVEPLLRVQKLAGRELAIEEKDITDAAAVEAVFADHTFDAVIHLAGLKAVGESVSQPLRYYECNVAGTVNLCRSMQHHNVCTIVFSSSATVYGLPDNPPVREDAPLGPTNPYGRTKLMCEQILRDLGESEDGWRIALLRYFNPVGAHPSGEIGESPGGVPNNLMPFVTQVAVGKREKLSIFGNDYPTPDGTGVRDYIHVCDLAQGHLQTVEFLEGKPGVHTFNLGTGHGYSVLELVKAFEEASGVKVPYSIEARRPGEVAACFADHTKAKTEMGWTAKRGLNEMCADSWRWQSQNPNGYEN